MVKHYPTRSVNWRTTPTVSQVQQLKSAGSQPAQTSQTPNAVAIPSPTYSGIPKPVTTPRTYVAAGSATTQRNVTVTFLGNPEDKNFSRCNIWFKGYHGQSNPVMVASATQGPITFPVDATSETVTVIHQSVGPKGELPLSVCPTSIVKLT
jgi:hypothetical protein